MCNFYDQLCFQIFLKISASQAECSRRLIFFLLRNFILHCNPMKVLSAFHVQFIIIVLLSLLQITYITVKEKNNELFGFNFCQIRLKNYQGVECGVIKDFISSLLNDYALKKFIKIGGIKIFNYFKSACMCIQIHNSIFLSFGGKRF